MPEDKYFVFFVPDCDNHRGIIQNMNVSYRTDIKFTASACYRICVKGFLDESWSERLSGMSIDNKTSDSGIPIAALAGQVRDQTELLGVLNSLYEMHLPLVSIELITAYENNSDLPIH